MRVGTDHRPVILKTAARLFGQKPYHEVLMDDVAAGAGVAKGTIYRFYRTKDDLYAAICLELLDDLHRNLQKISGEPARAQERLSKMVAGMVAHFRAHRDFFRVMQREWGGVCLPDRTAFLGRRRAAVEIFAQVLREGQKSGEFRSPNPVVAADMLLGMTRNMVRFGDPQQSAAQMTHAILDLFLHGIVRGEA